jgi:hypothetical protein
MNMPDAAAAQPTFIAAYLAGRCASGYAGGKGRIMHAVDIVQGGRLGSKSFCGKTCEGRSAGLYEERSSSVDCAACLRAMERQRKGAPRPEKLFQSAHPEARRL